MKKCLKFCILACVCVVTFSDCFGYQAASYNVGRRRVDLRWEQVTQRSKSVIELYGEVYGGANCNQLNVTVFLSNTLNGAAVSRLFGVIKDYSMSNYRFQAKDVVYPEKNEGKSWAVDNVYIECL